MKDYKKILEGVVDIINTAEKSDIGFANICSYIGKNCPELKESGDEKIRKAIIDVLKAVYECADIPFISQKQTLDSYISYLENQGEQKPVFEMKTPEESLGIDSDTYNKIVDECIYEYEKDRADAVAEMQKPWSEEDECYINQLIVFCENCMVQDGNAKKCANWLKDLKDRVQPQSTWKPSDEQMEYLAKAITNLGNEGDNKTSAILYELRTDLKKLKG